MSKAEEAAWKRFPDETTKIPYQELIDAFGGKTEVDFNELPRCYFQLGYEQALKDLELTWEDVYQIIMINSYMEVSGDFDISHWKDYAEEHCKEVLRRFKEAKK